MEFPEASVLIVGALIGKNPLHRRLPVYRNSAPSHLLFPVFGLRRAPDLRLRPAGSAVGAESHPPRDELQLPRMKLLPHIRGPARRVCWSQVGREPGFRADRLAAEVAGMLVKAVAARRPLLVPEPWLKLARRPSLATASSSRRPPHAVPPHHLPDSLPPQLLLHLRQGLVRQPDILGRLPRPRVIVRSPRVLALALSGRLLGLLLQLSLEPPQVRQPPVHEQVADDREGADGHGDADLVGLDIDVRPQQRRPEGLHPPCCAGSLAGSVKITCAFL